MRPTPAEEERATREVLDYEMEWYAQLEYPHREYPHVQRKYESDVAANQEMLDAYRTAIIRRCLAAVNEKAQAGYGGMTKEKGSGRRGDDDGSLVIEVFHVPSPSRRAVREARANLNAPRRPLPFSFVIPP